MKPTKQQFIERWRHDLAGMILEAAANKYEGSQLALFARSILSKAELRLGQYYEDCQDKPVPANGATGATQSQPKGGLK